MPENSDLLRRRFTEDQGLNGLLDGLFSDQPEEARELLKQIAAKWDTEEDESAEAICLYTGMASSLAEDDFRWTAARIIDRKKLRKERLSQYERFRELFELEICTAQKMKRSAMALGSDWSQMERYCRDWLVTARARMVLKLAGTMFRLHVPGAVDLCDWAAWRMYQNAYLAA